MNTGMYFNESLSKYRKAAGISQEKLADMLGVSRQAVSKWETGETQPEMANLMAICRILNITPNELLGYDSKGNEESKESATGENYKKKKRKSSNIIFAAGMIFLLIIFGICIFNTMTDPVPSPLEGRDRLEITGFDFEFKGGSEDNLILTFVPGLSSDELKYEVVRTDGSGDTQVYKADYSKGVCTCTVETIPNKKVIFTAKISDGDITLSQALFSVADEGDNFYTHEELWNKDE